MKLNQKVIIVTGSTRGIGYATAELLHKKGYNIVINGRNTTNLKVAKEKLNAQLAFKANVSIPDQAKQLVLQTISHFGRIDGIVCNVGNGKSVKIGNECLSEWKKMYCENFLAATNMVESSLKFLRRTKGSIVCISSICGLKNIKEAPLTYSVAKAALNFYVQGIAPFLAKNSVRINAIAPGNILFDGSVWDQKMLENEEEVSAFIKTEVPMGKLGKVENITSLVAFLLSESSDFTTGSIFTVDGGQTKS